MAPPRNIPAYVGKTAIVTGLSAPAAEHPRVCGENPWVPSCWASMAGTSPRMRGKHVDYGIDMFHQRNIPAYAGKTKSLFTQFKAIKEHLRVCGENRTLPAQVPRLSGTSPRMRGKLA